MAETFFELRAAARDPVGKAVGFHTYAATATQHAQMKVQIMQVAHHGAAA